jgi:NAD+ synthase
MKNRILKELRVCPTETFNIKNAIDGRIAFLKQMITKNNMNGYVLGISGGVDSFVAGKLAQLAVEALRAEGVNATFSAIRLPAHTQADEDEAQLALQHIKPDQILDVNVGGIADTAMNAVTNGLWKAEIPKESLTTSLDFAKGNAKARARMLVQYAIAGLTNKLVIGTDHNAEAVMGFYTKHGDGGCDLTVLDGLNKRQVRCLAEALGGHPNTVKKVPTADLEEDRPQVPDEQILGVSYDQIDDFLEGKEIDLADEQIIIKQFTKTIHKREMPVSFS